MSDYASGSVDLWLLVEQEYSYSYPKIVDMNEDKDGLDSWLEPNQRLVKVTVEFPTNFFKPAEYETVLQAPLQTPLSPSGGNVVADDKHVSFPE